MDYGMIGKIEKRSDTHNNGIGYIWIAHCDFEDEQSSYSQAGERHLAV
jgi:hypothetical protein